MYNSGRPFLSHHYLSQFVRLNIWEYRRHFFFFLENMHFHYITYMATPHQKNPCPGDHLFNNFGTPFLDHHFYTLIICLNHAQEQRRRLFLKKIQFYTLNPKITTPWRGGHEIYNFLSPYRCYISSCRTSAASLISDWILFISRYLVCIGLYVSHLQVCHFRDIRPTY